MTNVCRIIFALAVVSFVKYNIACNPLNQEWTEYMARYNKIYKSSDSHEMIAKLCYVSNKMHIEQHNFLFENGVKTFKLAINAYSDICPENFRVLFPAADIIGPSFDAPPPAVPAAAPPSFNPISFGLVPNIENQGTVCNSGWAYSVAKAIEILQAQQSKNMNRLSLSAQNLLDCAGSGIGCTTQVPQAAFDYLTKYKMSLHTTKDYPNNNTLTQVGTCTPQGTAVTRLLSYSRLRDSDDESLMAYLSNGYPIVVEMVPCYFEFMHYSSGVYQQPPFPRMCSHFVLLLGYGTDEATGLDYWLVQNSFGTSWGENGYMKLERTSLKKVFGNAIFPTELAG